MTEIVQKDAPVLRQRAQVVPVRDITTPRIQKILKEMQQALAREDDGVALAAPQVGKSLRMFIIAGHVFGEDAPDRVFINPALVRISKKKVFMHEGCLSVRHLYGMIERHTQATVRAYDAGGKQFTLGASGLLAQVFQHEIDHLDGILFIDSAVDIEEIPSDE